MKSNNYCMCFVLLFIFTFSFFSCTKEKDPVGARVEDPKARYLTINNKTDSEIKSYYVGTASGAKIMEGTTKKNSFYVKINKNFNNDSEIEVVIIDIYNRFYTKTLSVSLIGNTDVTIFESDRKSKGFWNNISDDLDAWFNKNK